MNPSVELSNFQKRCHEYYTCFAFATMGLQNIADQFRPRIIESQDQSLFIGSGHPSENKTQSRIRLKEAVMYSEKDGVFSDTLAKSMIIAIYTEWDETFRQKIGAEVGVESKHVMCDLMGDLRFIRHWLVHNKSIVDKNYTKFKVLHWHLQQGQKLKVSNEMFSEIIDCVNVMAVKISVS
jgi:hypothetical protein